MDFHIDERGPEALSAREAEAERDEQRFIRAITALENQVRQNKEIIALLKQLVQREG